MTNREKLIEIYNENSSNLMLTIVKTRKEGYFLMVAPNIFIHKGGYMRYDNDDLKANYDKGFDIVAVYKNYSYEGYSNSMFENSIFVCNLEKSYIEVSMQEIADKFGIDVKQLRIKK